LIGGRSSSAWCWGYLGCSSNAGCWGYFRDAPARRVSDRLRHGS
jgi:hypothetical protein